MGGISLRKRIFSIIVLLLLLVPSVLAIGLVGKEDDAGFLQEYGNGKPIVVSSSLTDLNFDDDEVDQEQLEYCGQGGGDGEMQAQSFIPTLPLLTRIQLPLWKEHPTATGELKISIRSELEGNDLTEIVLDDSEIRQYFVWYDFDFKDILVNPGETYFIVWEQQGFGDEENKNWIYWGYGVETSYANGLAFDLDNGIWHVHYGWSGYISDLDFCFTTYGKSFQPTKPEIPAGPEEGDIDKELTYSTSTTDPLDKQLYYKWDWGDGIQTNWTGPFESGERTSASHSWSEEGIYCVKVKAKNSDDLEADWSDAKVVGIPVKNNGKDQIQDTCDGHSYGVYTGYHFAQSFVPDQNTFSKLQLYIYKKGNPDTLTISIREELDGDDLTSLVKYSDDFPDEKSTWIEFDFEDIEVNAGKPYYIIWTPGEISTENNLFYWLFGEHDRYPSGCAWEGEPWEEFNPSQYEEIDFCFKTYHAKETFINHPLLKFFKEHPQFYLLFQRFVRTAIP
jgi:hypothetical protein